MLNQPSEYAANASPISIVADWLLELDYGGTSSGTYYFSGQDRNVTNFYHGAVMDWGVIDESIDLANSSASISDVQIVLKNVWHNASGRLSDELFGGSKYFINRDVTIRSWVNGITSASNCVVVYTGRLVDIQHDDINVTLTIEKRSPWDMVKIPQLRSSFNNALFPVAYGDFDGVSTSVSSPAQVDVENVAVYPTPFDRNEDGEIVCLSS